MTRSAPVSDSVLLMRTGQGDEAALAELYDRLGPAAYGLALRITNDPGLAEDAVQEAYLRVWNRADRFDRALGSPRAWLLRIVRNASIDRVRAEASLRRAETTAGRQATPAETPASGLDAFVESERRNTTRTALGQLSQEQQRALELVYFEGLSHSEIAEREGIPLGTVKSRIRQALSRLRSLLGGGGDA